MLHNSYKHSRSYQSISPVDGFEVKFCLNSSSVKSMCLVAWFYNGHDQPTVRNSQHAHSHGTQHLHENSHMGIKVARSKYSTVQTPAQWGHEVPINSTMHKSKQRTKLVYLLTSTVNPLFKTATKSKHSQVLQWRITPTVTYHWLFFLNVKWTKNTPEDLSTLWLQVKIASSECKSTGINKAHIHEHQHFNAITVLRYAIVKGRFLIRTATQAICNWGHVQILLTNISLFMFYTTPFHMSCVGVR